jgi:hypothetical protein
MDNFLLYSSFPFEMAGLLNDAERIDFLILRMLDFKEYVSNNELYSNISQHLKAKISEKSIIHNVDMALEILVESGQVAKYQLYHPINAKVDAAVDQKMPEYCYKLIK